MTKYRVQLIGGDKIFVNQEQKDKIEKLWLEKKSVRIKVGNQLIDISGIRGIFSDDEANRQDREGHKNNSAIEETNREFAKDCLDWSKKSPEAKAKREMNIRVLNCWKLMGGKREDKALTELYYYLVDWFKQNTAYPRCTSADWWNWLGDKGYLENKRPTYFSAILARQDSAVSKWVGQASNPIVKLI